MAAAPTTESRLEGGPYPLDDLDRLLDGGVTLFLDLTEEGELQAYAQRLPSTVRHVRMPVPDFCVPDDETMVRALDTIDDALGGGEVVYVHCRAGRGRTRTVLGCHRVRHGSPVGSGPPPETEEQREYVRSWRPGR